jgi:hypothetical protein
MTSQSESHQVKRANKNHWKVNPTRTPEAILEADFSAFSVRTCTVLFKGVSSSLERVRRGEEREGGRGREREGEREREAGGGRGGEREEEGGGRGHTCTVSTRQFSLGGTT